MATAINKQTELHSETRDTMITNQEKADRAEKQREKEMENIQKRMSLSDRSMQEGFSTVSIVAKQQSESADCIMVAAHGRIDGKMENDRQVAERMSAEILGLLRNKRPRQGEREGEVMPVTVQTQRRTPERQDKPQPRDRQLAYPPISHITRYPSRQTGDKWPNQVRKTKC